MTLESEAYLPEQTERPGPASSGNGTPQIEPKRQETHTAPVSRAGRGAFSPPRPAVQLEESPELLRWRADLLLDEMMLGGVDVSAADRRSLAPLRTAPAVDNGPRAESHSVTSEERPQPAATTRPPMPSSMPASLTNAYPDLDAPAARPWDNGTTPAPRPLPPVVSSADGAAGGEPTTRSERLLNLEQRYEQYRREQESMIQPAPPRAEPPVVAEAPRSAPPAPKSAEDDPNHWAEAPEKWLRQDFSPTPEPPVEPPPFTELGSNSGGHTSPSAGSVALRPDYGDAAVRQDSALFVNAMSVMGGKKRSNLLPRMSTLDVEQANRDITALHEEIAELLPAGHEASERARHLLDKAHTILHSDPMRSAEVEYYLQQVRTILQRRRQARAWSDLYRKRLRVYLGGWFSLAMILFLARYIFQPGFDAFVVWAFGVAEGGVIVQHWSSWVGTGAAGALGGAAGALYTMTRNTEGLFDRKYGLRGLMLPIIGLLVGLLLYPLFGLVFGIVGVNPALNLVVGAVPALVAFAFGYAQESIYGTRA